jgi:hypothetical protein
VLLQCHISPNLLSISLTMDNLKKQVIVMLHVQEEWGVSRLSSTPL